MEARAASRVECLDALTLAAAAWRLDFPRAREMLIGAAVLALVNGFDEPVLGELASSEHDDRQAIDDAVGRISTEFGLTALKGGADELAMIVTVGLAREVVAGSGRERELARWCHRFEHRSAIDAVNDLAVLDDDWDEAEEHGRDFSYLPAEVREVAAALTATLRPTGPGSGHPPSDREHPSR